MGDDRGARGGDRADRLGTMVSPVTFRHPAMLAKSVITADHTSGGRVELGMGAGWFEREHEAFGFPFPPSRADGHAHRAGRDRAPPLGRRGRRGDLRGEHYRLDACPAIPRAVQDPHPPLIIGGGAGPRSATLAARWADEYDVVYVDPAGAKERMDRVSAACAAIGRDPASVRRSLLSKTIVGTDDDDLRRKAAALMAWEDEDGDVGAFLEGLRAGHLAGTVEQVLERLAEYAAAGIQRVLVHQLVHTDLESIEMIGREIVPEAGRL